MSVALPRAPQAVVVVRAPDHHGAEAVRRIPSAALRVRAGQDASSGNPTALTLKKVRFTTNFDEIDAILRGATSLWQPPGSERLQLPEAPLRYSAGVQLRCRRKTLFR